VDRDRGLRRADRTFAAHTMSVLAVDHHGTEHFEFHLQQLTLSAD
jgi:hypothetical protein